MAWAVFLHPVFVAEPYWWEAYRPASGELVDLPRDSRVAIVGAGYAGLATALELARHGVEAVVLERGVLGIGASTRNGGSVSGGVHGGKSITRRAAAHAPEPAHPAAADPPGAVATVQRLDPR